MKRLSMMLLALLAGCASYTAKPLDPVAQQTAFESRRLDGPDVRQYIERRLRHEITPWPPKSWDITTLAPAAFFYHPDLRVAHARLSVSESAKVTAAEIPNPTMGLSSQFNTDAPQDESPWTLGYSFGIPIETAGKRGYRIEQAQHLFEGQRLGVAMATWNVRTRLRSRLVEHLLAVRNLESVKAEQTARAESVGMLETRFALGDVPSQDVEVARIAFNQTALNIHVAEGRIQDTRVTLADAIGIPVSALAGVEITHPNLERPTPFAEVPVEVVRREALLNRLDLRRALADYAASDAALKLEIAKQYPDLRLGPGYSWDAGTVKWSLGLSFVLPILNQNQGAIAEATARRELAAENLSALQTAVVAQVNGALARYRAAAQEYAAAKQLVERVEGRQRDVEALFAAGELDRSAIASAQVEAAVARRARNDALLKAQGALGTLETAVQKPLDGEPGLLPDTVANPSRGIAYKENIRP